jgi:hypothetical protein
VESWLAATIKRLRPYLAVPVDDRASYKNVVVIFPPEKREDKDKDIILLRLQTSDGQIQRLAMMSDTAKNLAAQILLISGQR